MHSAEQHVAVAVVALAVAGTTLAAFADPPTYGSVETFQPGKKYSCLPTPDHKGWDCKEIGEAAEPNNSHKEKTQPAVETPAAQQPVTVPPPAPPAPAHADTLPGYLTNAAAGGSTPAPAQPHMTQPAAKPVVVASPAKPALAPTSVTTAAKPTPGTLPAQTASEPRTPERNNTSGFNTPDFLALPGNHYVIELAHSQNEADLAATRAALHLPQGEVYELHLHQDGGNLWLLVWGSFDDVDAARAARAGLPASVDAGWPRRVAPLQAEVRRARE